MMNPGPGKFGSLLCPCFLVEEFTHLCGNVLLAANSARALIGSDCDGQSVERSADDCLTPSQCILHYNGIQHCPYQCPYHCVMGKIAMSGPEERSSEKLEEDQRQTERSERD